MWTERRCQTVRFFPTMPRMKTSLLLFTAAALAVPPARAQEQAASKSATVDVVESNGNAATLDSWVSAYGSFDKTKATTRALGITVRNMSASAPGDFEIEWFFFGKPANGGKRFLYDKGAQRLAVKPSAFEKFAVASKELTSERYHSAGTGYTYHSGDKADGWIVRVKSGGEVIRVKGSSVQFEQLEHDKAGFELMLKNMRKE